jgi:hypothetical protein
LKRLLLVVLGAAAAVAQSFPDFTPPTPLFTAVIEGDVAAVTRLLDSGVDPNEGRFIGASALTLSLMQQNPAVAHILLEKGANPADIDAGGNTPLMWAAASEAADPSVVRELLERGADATVRNKAGETALAWAIRRGYTPVVELLKKHGASDREMIRESVQRTVALLQKSGPEFVKVSGCSSCHNQSLPQMTWALARERGLQVDPQVSDKQAKGIIALFRPYREAMMAGSRNIPNPAISVSYLLVGLEAEGYKPNEVTEAMAHLVSQLQMPDGHFASFNARPPMESSPITATALSLRALKAYGSDPDPRVEKAREWLRSATARTAEEKAMKLLGLVWSKANAADLRAAAKPLLEEQRPDGGWAQLPAIETDAYATGQALFALHAAGQISVSDAVYARGTTYLLRTQRPDGSWLVRSRSFPFQPYKESGFPHGKDQWISAAGSSWAAMALMAALPPVQQEVSQLQ